MSKDKAESETKPMQDSAPVIGKNVMKEGNITFECEDIGKTRTRIDSLIAKFGGYVTSESEHTYYDKVEQRLEIRVPAEGLTPLLQPYPKGSTSLTGKTSRLRM